MPDSAAPSSASRPALRFLRSALLVVAALALWCVSIEPPLPPAPFLDASWQLALSDAHVQHRVFGRDVLFSAGPLGFLSTSTILPATFHLKLAWETAGKLALVVLIFAAIAPLPLWRKLVFAVAALLFTRLFPETLLLLALFLAVVRWLLPRAATLPQLSVTLALLALLSQFKFTLLLLAAAALALRAARDLLQRRFAPAFVLPATFLLAVVALWRLTGQPFEAFLPYVRSALDFSAGYPWAMAVDEPRPVFYLGVATAVITVLACIQIFRTPSPVAFAPSAVEPAVAATTASAAERWSRWPLALWIAGFLFFNWKHGFTRGDGHTHSFFASCLLTSLALPGLVTPAVRRGWFDLAAPLCIAGVWVAEPQTFYNIFRAFPHRFTDAARVIFTPRQFHAAWVGEFEFRQKIFARPALRQTVGTATVDLLNSEQGLLLLNGLHYHPRPVLQSYAAYTPTLLRANAAFFAGPSAPDFVVANFNTIDRRFPTLDDSLVLAELPLRYRPTLIEADHVVWRKKSPVTTEPAPAPRSPVSRERLTDDFLAIGAEFTLPPDRTHALWLELDVPPSLLGRLRAFFYKPALLHLVATTTDGRKETYRLVPATARAGFIIQPFLENFPDYALFAHGDARQWLRSIRLEPAAPGQTSLWSSARVRLSRLPDLPLREVPPATQPDVRFSNLRPVEITADLAPSFIMIDGESALFVHVASRVTFAPPATTRLLRGGFGIAEGAYVDGQTDGAEFIVEALRADGTRVVLWRRFIDPKANPPDRGLQRFETAVPAGTTRIQLLTTQGPSGQGDWDWTYWSRLEFLP